MKEAKRYTPEDLLCAIEAIDNGMTKREASLTWNIPKTTLFKAYVRKHEPHKHPPAYREGQLRYRKPRHKPRYTEKQLRMAVEAVRSGCMSTSNASLEYNVPRSTISDKINPRPASFRVRTQAKPIPKKYSMEDMLEDDESEEEDQNNVDLLSDDEDLDSAEEMSDGSLFTDDCSSITDNYINECKDTSLKVFIPSDSSVTRDADGPCDRAVEITNYCFAGLTRLEVAASESIDELFKVGTKEINQLGNKTHFTFELQRKMSREVNKEAQKVLKKCFSQVKGMALQIENEDCLFTAVGILLNGDEHLPVALRYLTCLHLIKNKEKYLADRDAKFFSAVSPRYEDSCLECTQFGGFASAWTVKALGDVLRTPIKILFPSQKKEEKKLASALNRVFYPTTNIVDNYPLYILWTCPALIPGLSMWEGINKYIPVSGATCKNLSFEQILTTNTTIKTENNTNTTIKTENNTNTTIKTENNDSVFDLMLKKPKREIIKPKRDADFVYHDEEPWPTEEFTEPSSKRARTTKGIYEEMFPRRGCYDLMAEVQSNPFIQEVSVCKGKNPRIILYHDHQMESMRTLYLEQNLSTLAVKKIVVGNLFITVITYRDIEAEKRGDDSSLFMIGPMFLHWDSDSSTYACFLSHLRHNLDVKEFQEVVFGMDVDKELCSAIKDTFGDLATVALCTQSLKKQFKKKYQKSKKEFIEDAVNDIFDRSTGLITMTDLEQFWVRLQELSGTLSQKHGCNADWPEWVESHVGEHVVQPVTFRKIESPFTNPSLDSLFSDVKSSTHEEFSIETIIDELCKLC